MVATAKIPGAANVTAPTSDMIVGLGTANPRASQVTLGILATFFGGGTGAFVTTNITTVGAGTLTAAALAGKKVVRTGPVAAFSDTTDTAAAIIAALPGGGVLNSANVVAINNATAFPMTILAGSGVTLPLTFIVEPFSQLLYAVQVVSASAVSLIHMGSSPIAGPGQLSLPQLTGLVTVGAGTILAAGFASGYVARTGAQVAAFTDTTDTAAAIIAACPELVGKIGAATKFRYVNNTAGANGFPATLTGGTGVTVAAVVPANSWADFIVTYTAAATLVFTLVGQGYFPVSGTVTANAATPVVANNAAVTPGSKITLTYKSGSVGATGAFVSASVPGTSFSIKSVASDTAVYNYTIEG